MVTAGREYTFGEGYAAFVIKAAGTCGIQVRCVNTGEILSPALTLMHVRSAHTWEGFRYV